MMTMIATPDLIRATRDAIADFGVEHLNILVRKANRDYDSEPAVVIALRHQYLQLAWVSAPLQTRREASAKNRLGQLGAYCAGAAQRDVNAIIDLINDLVGRDLPVQINCPDMIWA